jgi:porphobilinogen synthase
MKMERNDLITIRPRRLRKSTILREMVSETRLSNKMFIYPLFLVPGKNIQSPILSLDGQYHYSIDQVLRQIEECMEKGLEKFLLFGSGENKSEDARAAFASNSLISEGIRAIKARFGEDCFLMSDICLCAYTSHGHCGILRSGQVDNDLTVDVLSKIAVSHAVAGVDMVAPSDMMDGRIGKMRSALDDAGFESLGIMSYAIKYASSYYGPFREAAGSAPEFGDRKSYQMDFRNARESIREALLDEAQGADILMVKPALAYLDIIKSLSENTLLPIAGYNVSGEYALVKTAAKAKLVDEKAMVMENMIAFARAGASIIISYHARDIVMNHWIEE